MSCEMAGAMICRGTVTRGNADEGWDVESYTEAGIRGWGLKGTSGAAYEPGDRVYFFLFEDGDGMILGRM